jgi:hypothetical protein
MAVFLTPFTSLPELTLDEDAYVEAAVDEILQKPTLIVHGPSGSVTMLSFLQKNRRMSASSPNHVEMVQ